MIQRHGMRMTKSSEEGLIRALEDGDRDALSRVFDRHYDEVFAFTSRMLGDPHAAADATQETFLRVLRYGSSFGGRSSFRTWLLQVARNVCLDHIDERRRRREGDDAIPPVEAAGPEAIADPRLRLVRAAVDALPPTRRDVLVLRRFHGLSYAEIGELCGISEGAARVRAHRALTQLRDELAPRLEALHE
jgi:RNA polymerase sigma-70 factor (ECF subfamily)